MWGGGVGLGGWPGAGGDNMAVMKVSGEFAAYVSSYTLEYGGKFEERNN